MREFSMNICSEGYIGVGKMTKSMIGERKAEDERRHEQNHKHTEIERNRSSETAEKMESKAMLERDRKR